MQTKKVNCVIWNRGYADDALEIIFTVPEDINAHDIKMQLLEFHLILQNLSCEDISRKYSIERTKPYEKDPEDLINFVCEIHNWGWEPLFYPISVELD